MSPKFTVGGRIARPLAEVFEAVVDPTKLSAYFTTGGAKGRLVPGTPVTWDFHDFPGAFPVYVIEVEQNRRIVLRWDAAPDAADPDETGARRTTVTMTFEQLPDGRTLVRITEEGWSENPAGVAASYSNCEGWTGMLCAMKMWLEHAVQLRRDFYK
jgi:uncharacterized protein YndB with AHSA1/START domain